MKWIQNFLTGRTHQTRIGCSLSEIAELLSGVVQGSGLGLVLFLVFIDGLAKVLESIGVVTKFFADDVKVFLRIVKSDDCVRVLFVFSTRQTAVKLSGAQAADRTQCAAPD